MHRVLYGSMRRYAHCENVLRGTESLLVEAYVQRVLGVGIEVLVGAVRSASVLD